MKITYLGQAGVLFEIGETTIMVDPYLTDFLRESVGENFKRMVPVEPKYLQIHPDVILLSHTHGDHTDLPSLKAVLNTEKRVEVLAGFNAWKKVRETCDKRHNYVSLFPGTEWTTRDIHIRAIPAVHSDETAIGFLIHIGRKTIYFTGDTLYSEQVVRSIREPVDIMFTVMNGMGNNMNYRDAARMAKELSPTLVIPIHWGMFAQYSEDPKKFAKEAENNNVRVRVMQPYETMDIEAANCGRSADV